MMAVSDDRAAGGWKWVWIISRAFDLFFEKNKRLILLQYKLYLIVVPN